MSEIEKNDFITEIGGKKNGFFRRNIYLNLDEKYNEKIEAFRKEYKNTDIYYCMYSYESDDINNCNIIGSPYLDFDGDINSEESFNILRNEVLMAINYFNTYWYIPKDMIELYFSGSKGFHIVIPYQIFGLRPNRDLNIKNKMLAKLVAKQCNSNNIDLSIYDRRRLFRLPNSINSKSGLYKIPINYETLKTITLNELIELASNPAIDKDIFLKPDFIPKSASHYKLVYSMIDKKKEYKKNLRNDNAKKKITIPKKRRPLLPCVVNLLKTGTTEGSRNMTAIAMASSIMQSGISRDDTEKVMIDWNMLNDPPLSEQELVTTITSAYRELNHGRCYGCTSFKDLGYCIGSKCRIN
jgi:hypothetical protein